MVMYETPCQSRHLPQVHITEAKIHFPYIKTGEGLKIGRGISFDESQLVDIYCSWTVVLDYSSTRLHSVIT